MEVYRKFSPTEAIQYYGDYVAAIEFCPALFFVGGSNKQLYFPQGTDKRKVSFGDWIVKEGSSYSVYESTEFHKNFQEKKKS